MPIPLSQAEQDDYQLSKSVMDPPRSVGKILADFFIGRSPAEKATSALTGMAPGIVFKGAVTPGIAAAKNSPYNSPFRWIYGDLRDFPKFEATPKSYDALVDPARSLVGVAESTIPGSMTLHQDLLRAITEYQNQTRQMAKLSGALKSGDFGMDPAGLDQFGHVRLLPADSVYQRKMTIGAPYDYLGHGRNPYSRMPEVSSQEGLRFARREQQDLDAIGRILERLNLYPRDVDVRLDTLWDRYLQ